jgi:hypothetical protein
MVSSQTEKEPAMITRNRKLFVAVLVVILLGSCAAGDARFTQANPAGFWYGLWHGAIAVIALIVHIFNNNVAVYEVNNTGGWYDFGFLCGVILVWGGGSHASRKSAKKKKREKEWDEISDKVEKKIMRRLKEWAEEEEGTAAREEWDEIGEKVEQKLKRKIREWAEKD